jgi:hypothetical protein
MKERRTGNHKMPRSASLPLVTAAFVLALTAFAAAQDYPTKPIRMIIPFPPGGGSDVTGRVVATALELSAWANRVIVDNQRRRRRAWSARKLAAECAEGWLHR